MESDSSLRLFHFSDLPEVPNGTTTLVPVVASKGRHCNRCSLSRGPGLDECLGTLLFAFTVTGYWIDFFIHVIWASLVAIVGLALLARPALSAEAIMLLMSFYFFMEGAAIIGFALSSHIESLWIYVTQGFMAWLLGALLLFGWPVTGLWAFGAFIGIDLLFKGWAIIALGLGLRAISEGPILRSRVWLGPL